VAGLVAAERGFRLQQAEARTGVSGEQLAGDGEAKDASADYSEVALGRRWAVA